jgi:hypothetical protein
MAVKKILQIVILALNYLHFRNPFQVLDVIGRRPSEAHKAVYARLSALIRAGGPTEEFSILGCGRKSFQLDARLEELVQAVQSLGLDQKLGYGTLPVQQVAMVNDKDELRPYRELCAARLKLSGNGQWDPRPYLSDLFYMPFVEPRINQYDITPPHDVLPNLSAVKKDEVLAL